MKKKKSHLLCSHRLPSSAVDLVDFRFHFWTPHRRRLTRANDDGDGETVKKSPKTLKRTKMTAASKRCDHWQFYGVGFDDCCEAYHRVCGADKDDEKNEDDGVDSTQSAESPKEAAKSSSSYHSSSAAAAVHCSFVADGDCAVSPGELISAK